MAEPLPEFGDLPLVVAAEREQGAQRGEGAGAERAPETIELGERGAERGRVEFGIAGRLLQQRFLGFGDEPRLQFPVTADTLGALRIDATGERGDLFARRAARPIAGAQRLELGTVLGGFCREPALGFSCTEAEHGDQRDGGGENRAHHRDHWAIRELIERRVQCDRDAIAGNEPQQAEMIIGGGLAVLALGELVRDCGE